MSILSSLEVYGRYDGRAKQKGLPPTDGWQPSAHKYNAPMSESTDLTRTRQESSPSGTVPKEIGLPRGGGQPKFKMLPSGRGKGDVRRLTAPT